MCLLLFIVLEKKFVTLLFSNAVNPYKNVRVELGQIADNLVQAKRQTDKVVHLALHYLKVRPVLTSCLLFKILYGYGL